MGITDILKRVLFPPKNKLSKREVNKIKQDWDKIENKIKSGGESNFKIAVIDADKLFGKVLELLGYREETWAKSMAQASKRFSRSAQKDIWRAHKLRNRLVHDDQDLHSYQAVGAIKKFKKGLKELNIL